MILGYTERNTCLFISFGLMLGLWVLQRFSPKLKPLGFASVISFLMLLVCLKVHWDSPYMDYFCIIVMFPGFIITSLLSNPWQATHSTDWKVVTFVISFIFNTVLLFGVFRGVSCLKKKWSKHTTNQNQVDAKPE